ncbi:MAG TPA: hypothetical protein VM778_13280, partial [Gemmatimonadota bacterium]|nr:hypothetical protein [Gemmatimonadota bacterium]
PGEDAILPAALARGVEPWEEFLGIARDDRIPSDTREKAAIWLGRAAGERMAGQVEALASDEVVDLPVREAALYALSELNDVDAGITALLRIARTSPSIRIRERALFWLAETGDPRALALFEEILVR